MLSFLDILRAETNFRISLGIPNGFRLLKKTVFGPESKTLPRTAQIVWQKVKQPINEDFLNISYSWKTFGLKHLTIITKRSKNLWSSFSRISKIPVVLNNHSTQCLIKNTNADFTISPHHSKENLFERCWLDSK